jgi:hypothetical protein
MVRFHMVLQPPDGPGIRRDTQGQHHMRLDDLPAIRVRGADHGAFGHIGMLQQRRLDLGPGDVVARD